MCSNCGPSVFLAVAARSFMRPKALASPCPLPVAVGASPASSSLAGSSGFSTGAGGGSFSLNSSPPELEAEDDDAGDEADGASDMSADAGPTGRSSRVDAALADVSMARNRFECDAGQEGPESRIIGNTAELLLTMAKYGNRLGMCRINRAGAD